MLTLVFGIAVFLFWRYRYPFALTYQEQLQLFLFDGDYFWERMTEPGGFARYIAEFLVQFYNGVTIGAVIIALLLMLVQRLTWRLMFSESHYALSFIPVMMLWYAMGDESVMLTYVVALVLALAAALLLRQLELVVLDKLARLGKLVKLGILLFLIPLLYWLIGPMVLLVGGRIDAAMDSSGWCSGLCVGTDPAQRALVAFPDVEGIAGH